MPTTTAEVRFGRASELWAALSLSALLLGLVVLVVANPDRLLAWVAVFVIAFVIAESFLRGTFASTVNRTAVGARLDRSGDPRRPLLERPFSWVCSGWRPS